MPTGSRARREGARQRLRPDCATGILGEVKCLKLELDSERSRAEQERGAAARQLALAKQEGQAALQQKEAAHKEEVKHLQDKWVGGKCC